MNTSKLLRSPTKSIVDRARPCSSRSDERIVQLNVGGRRFETLGVTLTSESAFFQGLLSGRWESGTKHEDGSYFVDANPELFEHILSYLRRGTYPFLYSSSGGFDVAKYSEIEREAEYFQVEGLAEWIRERKYEGGVNTKFHAQLFKATNSRSFTSYSEKIRKASHEAMEYVRNNNLVDVKLRTVHVPDNDSVRLILCGRSMTVLPDVFKAPVVG